MTTNAYTAHAITQIREDLRTISDAIFGTLGTAVFIVLALLLYSASGKTIFFGTFTWPMIAWYLIITQVLIRVHPALIPEMSNAVRTGEIVAQLTRPYIFPIALLAQQIAGSAIALLTCLLFIVPFGIVLFGTAVFSTASLLVGLVAIIGAVLSNALIESSIGLVAFWTEDAKPYAWVYGKIVFLFGGLLFPLDLFPTWLQGIAKVLPPAFAVYYPARLFVDFSWELARHVLLWQAGYAVLFGIVFWAVYTTGKKKVELNGG
jgi:ABC-2 type transport system permease protein